MEISKPTRDYGIDLFRIISMLLIIMIHILNLGGVYYGTPVNSSNNILVCFLYGIAAPCVECFGIISGFVGYSSKHKFTNIIMLWIQIVIYVWIGNLIWIIFQGPLPQELLWQSIFPFFDKYNWFYSAYFGLFILSPFLKAGIEKMGFKANTITLITLFLMLSFAPVFFGEKFGQGSGYSVIWLCFCYIMGAYIKKYYEKFKAIKTWVLLIIYFACVLLITIFLCLERSNSLLVKPAISLSGYNSPFCCIQAMTLLILFSRVKPNKTVSLIKLLTPLVFGVFLVHTNAYIWEYVLPNAFKWICNLNPILFMLAMIACTFGIFIVSAAIDFIRQYAFNKIELKQKIYSLEKRVLDNDN